MDEELKRAKAREASRRWRANNPQKVKAANDGRNWDKTVAASRSWQARNPEKAVSIGTTWKQDHPAAVLWHGCKRRAQDKGYAFELTQEDIQQLLAPMECSVTRIPLVFGKTVESYTNPWAPSVDKIQPSKGYVRGNVRIVCWAYNQMRGDFPDEVVFRLAKALVNNFEAVEGED